MNAKDPAAPENPYEPTVDSGPASESDEDWVAVVEGLPVTLAMEVGRRQITIRELLQLNVGSVIELDRGTKDVLDVFVNGKLLAYGEAIAVNGKCGLRVIDVRRPRA